MKKNGFVTNGQLASLPSECSEGNYCFGLPEGYYWLNQLVQWDCEGESYSTTYGSSSCSAFSAAANMIYAHDSRVTYGNKALCE